MNENNRIKANEWFERARHDLAIDLTEYYIEEKYPPVAIEVSLEEVQSQFEQARELVDLVMGEEAK